MDGAHLSHAIGSDAKKKGCFNWVRPLFDGSGFPESEVVVDVSIAAEHRTSFELTGALSQGSLLSSMFYSVGSLLVLDC